ncbi:MAG: hypothetical protein AAGG51_06145 [Cyanobacteria bacterium P01_G01_bin.54]
MENNTQLQPTAVAEASPVKTQRTQPIPPPSEPRQYRAIGLVQGQYVPSEEQSTKGTLITEDGAAIDAVLLGRVISLVKNHLSLEEPHLWVVYPRTRQEEDSLHVQIVGVWEPDKLQAENPPEDVPSTEATEGDEAKNETIAPVMEDGYFSIRGEAVFCAADKQTVIVKIQQLAKKPNEKRKSFKLHLKGELSGDRPVGHFWDLHLQRQGSQLLIQDAEDLGFIPKKRKKFIKKGGRKGGSSYSRKPKRVIDGNNRPVPHPTEGLERREGGTPRPNKPSKPIRRSQRQSS